MDILNKTRRVQGHIPTRIRVYLRPALEYKGPNNIKVLGRPAFICNAESKSFKAAQTWATQYGIPDMDRFKPFEMDNDPIPMLTLVGLDIRGEGGRAYKVVTPDGFLVDLREDVMLETMFRKGIKPGEEGEPPTISGPFQWAFMGNHMKLVLVGSQLHKDVLEAQERQRKRTKTIPLSAKDLKPGTVYESRDGGPQGYKFGYVYLGRVRVRGKLQYGWFYLGMLRNPEIEDWQAEADRIIKKNRGFAQISVTGSPGKRVPIGKVTGYMPKETCTKEWVNGYNENIRTIHISDIGWEWAK